MKDLSVEDIEIGLFVEAMHRRHGYDFRHYAKASLRRRILALANVAGCRRISELILRVLHEDAFLGEAIAQLTVPVSDMFRDPPVFKALRERVLPLLKGHARLNVWQPGCAYGEEAYSFAILLAEEGLLERTQIYATDINDRALQNAEDGIFSSRKLDEFERNYKEAGGRAEFSDYYTTGDDSFRICDRLREKVVFAHHNLVSDGAFCEVHAILCRNVLIYFDSHLQTQVLRMFDDSLVPGGFLCLGTRESLRHTEAERVFAEIDRDFRIFRKAEGALR